MVTAMHSCASLEGEVLETVHPPPVRFEGSLLQYPPQTINDPTRKHLEGNPIQRHPLGAVKASVWVHVTSDPAARVRPASARDSLASTRVLSFGADANAACNAFYPPRCARGGQGAGYAGVKVV